MLRPEKTCEEGDYSDNWTVQNACEFTKIAKGKCSGHQNSRYKIIWMRSGHVSQSRHVLVVRVVARQKRSYHWPYRLLVLIQRDIKVVRQQ